MPASIAEFHKKGAVIAIVRWLLPKFPNGFPTSDAKMLDELSRIRVRNFSLRDEPASSDRELVVRVQDRPVPA